MADSTVGEGTAGSSPPGMTLGSVWLMFGYDPVSAGNIKNSTTWGMRRMARWEQGHRGQFLVVTVHAHL